jgi:hypothetical protein
MWLNARARPTGGVEEATAKEATVKEATLPAPSERA